MHIASTWIFASLELPLLGSLPRGSWVLAGPAALFLFYLAAWWRIGPEPEPGPLVARYGPPEGLSAAAVRYIAHGTTDGRSFAAVIAQLAVRGCIRVEPVGGGYYRLSRLMCGRAAVAALAPEERRVLGALFEDGPVRELSPSWEERNAAQNGRYVAHIHQELAKQLRGKYFTRHTGVVVLGCMATFAIATSLAFAQGGWRSLGIALFTNWIVLCGLILGLLVEISLIPAWKNVLHSRVGILKMLPGTAAMAVLIGVMGFMTVNLGKEISPYFTVTLVVLVLLNLAWAPRLKRRSPLGRRLSDEIAGYRQFLETVEHDPLNRIDPGHQLPRKLDSDLPYAIALGVKAAWGDHLTQTFLASTVMVED